MPIHGYEYAEYGYDCTLNWYNYARPWNDYTFLGYYFRPCYDYTLYGLYSIERLRIEGSDAQYNPGGEIAVLRNGDGMACDIRDVHWPGIAWENLSPTPDDQGPSGERVVHIPASVSFSQ